MGTFDQSGSDLSPKVQSLAALERELSFDLLSFIEHGSSITSERGFSTDSGDLVEIKDILEKRRGRTAVSQPQESLAEYLLRKKAAASQAAHDALVLGLGETVEKFRATSGWIFLRGLEQSPDGTSYDHTSDELIAVAAYNAPIIHQTFGVDGSKTGRPVGVVGRVARTGRPYVIEDDCEKDPYYWPAVATTQSLLAVPIHAPDNTVIGVLNLEANYPCAFLSATAIQVYSHAFRFAEDLLTLRLAVGATHGNCWHPAVDGWAFRSLLDGACRAIAQALPTQHGNPSIGCTVWHNDADKERLFVRGTVRFDYEYVRERTLSRHSHIGGICNTGRLSDRRGRTPSTMKLVQDLSKFRRVQKAQRMEMRSVAVFPFGAGTPEPDHFVAAGALVIYGFEHQYGIEGISVPQLFNESVGERLASTIGESVETLVTHRASRAVARLNTELRNSVTAARNPFETIIRSLSEMFEADGCSIFQVDEDHESITSGDPPEVFLRCRATTGLISNSPHSFRDGHFVYPINGIESGKLEVQSASGSDDSVTVHYGMTNYLGNIPNVVLRKNDVLNILERVRVRRVVGSEQGAEYCYFRPRNTLIEAHAPGTGEHMRFLAMSIGPDSREEAKDSSDQQQVSGVIRLTRSADSPPFTRADEELLGRLNKTLFPVVHGHRMRQGLHDSFSERLLHRNPTAYVSGISDFRALLEDTALACKHTILEHHRLGPENLDTVVLSCLRFRGKNERGTDALRVYAVYPMWSSEPPEEEKGEAMPRDEGRPAHGWCALNHMKMVTFRCEPGKVKHHLHTVHKDVDWVRYGVLVPFRTFSMGRCLDAVVSVDFAEELPAESGSEIEVTKWVLLSASKCIWLLAVSELAMFGELRIAELSKKLWMREFKERWSRLDVTFQVRHTQDHPGSNESGERPLLRERDLIELEEQIVELGGHVRGQGEQLLWSIPLWTLNGTIRTVLLGIDLDTIAEHSSEFALTVRLMILSFLSRMHSEGISRHAFGSSNWKVAEQTADSHDVRFGQIDYWEKQTQNRANASLAGRSRRKK